MKIRKSYIFLILFILINSVNLQGQVKVRATVNVFDPLPEVSFAAFLTNPFIPGTPRIFQVILTPQGEDVIVVGTINWRKPGEGRFRYLLDFKTKPFKSRNFYNDQINSDPDLRIDDSDYDKDLVSENLRFGKPTGLYNLIIQVYNLNMELLDEQIVDLGIKGIGFVNPSQTLELIQPLMGSYQNSGGVILTWSEVIGVTDFVVLSNVRSSKEESLEESLKKGNPIVDNRSVGLSTTVNLREILDRELVPGQEIVVQVRGLIPNPGGENVLYSNIVNFYISDPNSSSSVVVSEELIQMLQKIVDGVKNNPPDLQGEEEDDLNRFIQSLEELLEKLRNGEITFDELMVTTKSGSTLSYPEFIQLLEKLVQYPNLITNINFEEK